MPRRLLGALEGRRWLTSQLTLRCDDCGKISRHALPTMGFGARAPSSPALAEPPRCPSCGASLRYDFETYARGLSIFYFEILAVVAVLATLAWWPLDGLVLPDEASRHWFGVWRVGLLAVCGAGYLIAQALKRTRHDVAPIFLVLGVVCAVGPGYAFAQLDSLGGLWLHVVVFATVPAILQVVPLRWRVVTTTLIAASFVTTFLLSGERPLEEPYVGLMISNAALFVVLASVYGHAYYRLIRSNFAGQRALEDEVAHLEARVAARSEELRQLGVHFEARHEQERGRIAREIHDELGQLLTALRMKIELARSAEGPERESAFEGIGTLLKQCFTATRDLVSELRPRILDELGLAAAVEWSLQRFAERSRLDCRWSIEPAELDVEPAQATAAFRILQESLTNVARHARARRVEVTLRQEAGALSLLIADDGEGFEPSAVPRSRFGLLGMRERARALRGEIAVESRPGFGTRVLFTLPESP